jgi:hypothetical protein
MCIEIMACYLGTEGLTWSTRKEIHIGCLELKCSDKGKRLVEGKNVEQRFQLQTSIQGKHLKQTGLEPMKTGMRSRFGRESPVSAIADRPAARRLPESQIKFHRRHQRLGR